MYKTKENKNKLKQFLNIYKLVVKNFWFYEVV